jgi:5,5'-dehydrodivanillate O-demethylase
MITKEENELLTHVGAGTPMGNLLRRYWHPVGAVAELEREPVQPIRIMGEDLTLFRSERDQYGLVAQRCAHRGISLAYGIPQQNGLRCAYHGWTYDTAGHVVDMPFEPACLPIKVTAYPVQELGGLVWAYLGPEPAPLLPRYDLFVRDDVHKEIMFKHLPCSWLQCMDNSLDPIHFEHLHGTYGGYLSRKLGRPPALNPARHMNIDFDVFEYGIYKRRLLEGQPNDETNTDWAIGHPILFPNILAQGTPHFMSWQIRVPMDDANTMHVLIGGTRPEPGTPPQVHIPATRDAIRYDELGRVFAPDIVNQDEMAWVGQGPISDRTAEHLATSDKGIMLYRQLLLDNIAKVERGEDPMAVVRDPAQNFPMIQIARGSQYTAFVDRPEERDPVYWGFAFAKAQ